MAAFAGLLLLPVIAQAQGAALPDVPANHWAYQAVTDLANKGYVKGYPDGRFLGGRTLTRFEFATVIDRMSQTIDDLSQKVAAGQQVTTPTGAPVTQDDLNKIQSLVDSFQQQLATIQSNAATNQAQFQAELDKLRGDLAAVKSEADNSYGAGPGRKYSISGYIQARYLAVGSSSEKNFPQGIPTSSSAYNGTYAAGGNTNSFLVRRARIKVAGAPTQNTHFTITFDTAGFANNTPSTTSNSSNAAVTADEAWASYTLGDGNPGRYPTVVAGQFYTQFGYLLPLTSSATLLPESPLAFNEGSAGLFANQKYDRGVELNYFPSLFRFYVSLVNGTGNASDDESRRVDAIFKAGAHTKNDVVSGDVSYYDGHVPFTKATGTSYIEQDKQLWDVDAQITAPNGPFLLGEYVAGKYEQRSFFDEATASATNPFGFGSAPAPGNMIKGYYIQGGWAFDAKGAHPLTLFGNYDVLNRSDSGVSANDTVAGAPVVGGPSGSSFDDINQGYGVMYNVDRGLRLRLFYIQPDRVAHAANTPEPPRSGLTTAEVQVSY